MPPWMLDENRIMKFSLAISPCPNDTFIFDALIHGKLGKTAFDFDLRFEDVQALNQLAIEGKPDICKVSVGVLPLIAENYQILDAGAALGKGCGPLLIAATAYPADSETIENLVIAVPGENTTAHLLLTKAFPGIRKKRFMVFSAIEEAVCSGSVDAGLIIHENRFTYAAKGLKKIMDLGEFWEQQFSMPVPLGCIVVKRSLSATVKLEIEKLIRQSVQFALLHPSDSEAFVRSHAREMDPAVIQQHIGLYVNAFSISLGTQGKQAIRTLLLSGQDFTPHREVTEPLFVGGD